MLDFIRYHQHLTGTKIGCREGDCGACTVLIGEIKDGELVYNSVTSCLMPIGNAQGKHIVTIEGLNVNGLNFIQQSFADEGATQCGFCTPGQICSAVAMLDEIKAGIPSHVTADLNNSPKMSNIEFRERMSGNICRCGAYSNIQEAIAEVAGGQA